jgi:hypothetical protein
MVVMVVDHHPKLVMIIERRSSAAVIIDYLLKALSLEGINPFTRLFNWIVNDAETDIDKFNEVKRYYPQSQLHIQYKKYFGYATSSGGKASRDQLYTNTLLSAATYTADRVYDPILIEQISSLTTKNGRIDHTSTGKDDLCIAWLLTHWLITQGRNLDFYHIQTSKLLGAVKQQLLKDQGVDETQQMLIKRD